MTHPVPLKGFLLAIIVLVSLVAACGDDEVGPPPNATDQEPTPVLEGAGATFIDLLTQGLDSTYTVTYETLTPEGAKSDTYRVFYRPPLARIDSIPPDPSLPSALITGGDKDTVTISCSGGPDQWKCFEIEPLGDSLLMAAGPVLFLSAVDVAPFEVTETEQRTIAGQVARCFRLSPRERNTVEDIEYCLSKEGVPLYSALDVRTIEATEFSAVALDEDFLPPAEP